MIKVGILGYGYMGKIREAYFGQNPNCVVTSIFHNKSMDGPFQYFDDWRQIVEDQSIDAIVVCLPNFLTCEAVTSSLAAGKHVFAEKPPGISSKEVEKIIEAERTTGRVLKFGFNHRYHPAVLKAKELVDSKQYGDILWLRGRYGKSVDQDFDRNWRAKKDTAGGGILMDQGIHMLDLMLYFCEDFDEVKAFASNLYWKGEVEDNVFAIMKNKKGQVASVHSTMTQWRYLFALEIFLQSGYIVVNGLLSKSGRYGQETIDYATNRSPMPMASHSEVTSITYNNDFSWKYEVDEFVDAILEGRKIKQGTTEDALKIMRLVERIYKDAGIPS